MPLNFNMTIKKLIQESLDNHSGLNMVQSTHLIKVSIFKLNCFWAKSSCLVKNGTFQYLTTSNLQSPTDAT
jgi:hypothetical protein